MTEIQTKLSELQALALTAIEAAASEGNMTEPEVARQVQSVMQRLNEAGMLIALATGNTQPVTLHVQPVLRAAMEVDKAARRVLNTDIDITHLTPEQQAEAMQMMELAEEGYAQWRALSALSMMHLDSVFRSVSKAVHVAA